MNGQRDNNPLMQILGRWGLAPEAPNEIEAEVEQEIFRCLGAAVIASWADLPRVIQRHLFQAAVAAGRPGREDIALFLHAHHRDTSVR